MCSLFIIVYLIETSLWVWSLVPAPPAASPALCPDTEGEMASSVPFWKLSSCQSGSDIFTMLPWAHLLCPHPRPRHCKPPLPTPHTHTSAPPRNTAPEPNPHVTRRRAAGYRSQTFSLHLVSLCLSVVLSPQHKLKTDQNSKNWICFPCCSPLKRMTSSPRPHSLWMWSYRCDFSVHLSDPEVQYAASGWLKFSSPSNLLFTERFLFWQPYIVLIPTSRHFLGVLDWWIGLGLGGGRVLGRSVMELGFKVVVWGILFSDESN